MNKQVITF